MNVASYIIPVGLAEVALVLLAGLFNMLKGGSSSTSQKIMRRRVGLQFATIIVVMASLYISGR